MNSHRNLPSLKRCDDRLNPPNIPGYGILNFSASIDIPTAWTSGLQDVKASFEVDNLADKRYDSFEYITAGGLYNTGAGAAIAFPGAPRAWYVTLTASF